MKYNDIRKKIRSPLFSRQDLRLLGGKVFAYQLSRWQKLGHIKKLKNGLYVFAEQIHEAEPETVAARLYSPSYISLEKALALYGLIPEMVYAFTSVTPKTTRKYKNEFGDFHYRHIKPKLYFGYRPAAGGGYLIAEPEKAMLDYLYFNAPSLNDRQKIKESRLNLREIRKQLSRAKFYQYLKVFANQQMIKIAGLIMGENRC